MDVYRKHPVFLNAVKLQFKSLSLVLFVYSTLFATNVASHFFKCMFKKIIFTRARKHTDKSWDYLCNYYGMMNILKIIITIIAISIFISWGYANVFSMNLLR